MDEFARYFLEGIKKDPKFILALEIVRKNSSGKIWVIGGAVYKTIISELYGYEIKREPDYDFIVEKVADELFVPEGGEVFVSGGGNPRIVFDDVQLDIVPLDNAVSSRDKPRLNGMNVDEKLRSYFRRVPLSVQAIVFDMKDKNLFGDVGLESIRDKKIRIIDKLELESYCSRHKISCERYIDKKVGCLGFELD